MAVDVVSASRRIVLLALLAGALVGCRAGNRPLPVTAPPTTRPVEVLKKAAVDLTKGGAGFPLQSQHAPQSVEELVGALRGAYVSRLESADTVRVNAEGSTVRHLRSLSIDLSDGAVAGSFVPKSTSDQAKATPFLHVDRLSYVADPLRYQTYAASLVLQAEDARMALVRGADKNLTLAMYDCREGRATLAIGLEDLERGLAAGARLRGSLAFAIHSVQVRMRSQSPHALEAELTVNTRVLMVPARFRLTGREDVDENFNIHFTHLKAQGDDPGGAVLAGVVQGKLDLLNNKAAPLLKLPGDRIRVTDLRLTLDSRLTVDVKFAGSLASQMAQKR